MDRVAPLVREYAEACHFPQAGEPYYSPEFLSSISVSGKVYNVAPYMEYHPGGIEQLMRAAGTDGTKLFNEVST